MRRLILGYLPANLVPALVAVGGIALTTRLLDPAQVGRYTLVFGAVMVAQGVLFTALALAITRFHASAARDGGEAGLLAAAYQVLVCVAFPAGAAGALASAVLWHAEPGWSRTIALATALLLLRGLVAVSQSVRRAEGAMRRYNAIECLHAALGLAAGVAFVEAGWRSGDALLAGLAAAAGMCALLDARCPATALAQPPDRAALRTIVAFAWPQALAYAVTFTLLYADRLLVGTIAGAASLGVYGVAFSLVDRPVTLICVAVTAGTFPLAVSAMVEGGEAAGRRQAGLNGALLIGLALPAATGLALTAPAMARVLLGPAFAGCAAALIPVMAATALLRGISTHFVDHAFHLAAQSRRMLAAYAPWAAASLALDALIIPRFGARGAAWSALGCQAGALATAWCLAEPALKPWLPAGAMVRTAFATLAMAGVLVALAELPLTAGGLCLRIAAGLGTYACLALGPKQALRLRSPHGLAGYGADAGLRRWNLPGRRAVPTSAP